VAYRDDILAAKRKSVRKYLIAAQGNIRQAARLAGVSREHFYKILAQLGERQWLYDPPRIRGPLGRYIPQPKDQPRA
jgi:hypothetical protein